MLQIPHHDVLLGGEGIALKHVADGLAGVGSEGQIADVLGVQELPQLLPGVGDDADGLPLAGPAGLHQAGTDVGLVVHVGVQGLADKVVAAVFISDVEEGQLFRHGELAVKLLDPLLVHDDLLLLVWFGVLHPYYPIPARIAMNFTRKRKKACCSKVQGGP